MFKSLIKTKIQKLTKWSVEKAAKEQNLTDLIGKLRKIAPDISRQELTAMQGFNEFWELKRRTLQAFQCQMMLSVLDTLGAPSTTKGTEKVGTQEPSVAEQINVPPDLPKITVVDIGDSAGTHMLYLKELTKDRFTVDTISVNLDPAAIEKITARGLKAILCRAEELDLGDQTIDLFTSFQMVEHLHNPSLFFYRIAKRSTCNKIIVTLPYLKHSRVGLHNIRHRNKMPVIAEEEHVFELNPGDWELLMLHSGWRVSFSKIYYQYPRKVPVIRRLLGQFWKRRDYEGFWGAVLEKDTTYADCYQDWED